MPLIDDPTVTRSLLTPRGFIPLPGSDEEIRPINPEPPEAPEGPGFFEQLAPTPADKITIGAAGALNPLLGAAAAIFTNPTGEAAARQNNTVASAVAKFQDTYGVSNDLTDPNYSPWLDVAGTSYEKYWKSTFAYSNNPQYTEALKRSIDRQEQDRRTVDASGSLGTVAGILAGTIDPTLLLPVGGEISLAGKGVWNVSRGALAGARASGLGTAAYELALQGSQDTRPVEESITNIGTGVVLGAVLGGTIAGALSRTQRVGSEKALENLYDINIPGSVGAAAPHKFTLDEMQISGNVTKNVAAATAFSPTLRGNFRESPLAIQTYYELIPQPLRVAAHAEGLSPFGQSVETNINVSLSETLGQAVKAHPAFYIEGKKAGFGMSSDEFDEAVGPAMRRNDEGVNEYVSKAAKMWRSTVVDPLTKQAIELKLLPEDVSVQEADSYFTRQWNRDKVIAQKPQFIAVAQEHYHGILQENYVKEGTTLQTKQSVLDKELEILRMKPKARAKRIAELKALEKDEAAQKLAAKFDDVHDNPEEGSNYTSVADRIKAVEKKKKDLDYDFRQKWEIKRLGEGIDLTNPDNIPDFSIHARDMAQDTYDSITGADFGSASVDPQFHLAAKSGPLKERTFHIPDAKVEQWLNNNVVDVMSQFARTMSAQNELARKFPGDPLLNNRVQEIQREYDALVNAAGTEAERTKLTKDMHGAIRDIRSLVELHRGSYKAQENGTNFARTVRSLMVFNFIRSMGGSAIPSLSDLYNPAIQHGVRALEVGVPALMKTLAGNASLSKISKEADLAVLSERIAHHRLLTLSEIGDPYRNGTPFERYLENGMRFATKWTGLNLLTDVEKRMDAEIVMHRLNEALLKKNDNPFLAYSGMSPDIQTIVAEELDKHHSFEDGWMVANTDQWENPDAVRAYRNAVSFNVDQDIVTRGKGDVPLRAYDPFWKAFFQFKTFNLSAHQRTFLRATQLGPAQFLSGLMGLTTLGMMTAWLRAVRSGDEGLKRFYKASENPGYLVGEGIDNTGFFTLPLELSNLAEKSIGEGGHAFNPVKTPLMLAGRLIVPDSSVAANSQRYSQKSLVEALAGPTGGLISDAGTASGIPINLLTGEEVTQGRINAANRLVPYQSYYGMREMLQVLEGNSPYDEDKSLAVINANE